MGQIERVALKYIHYHVENRHLVGSCCLTEGAQPGALWQARGVGWGGREVQEGGNICMPVADPHWCMAETNAAL